MRITEATIHEPWHAVRTSEPVRFGLPLARGVVSEAEEIGLEIEGREVPLQARTLSRWPDGSVRWALVDFQADLDLRRDITLNVIRRERADPIRFPTLVSVSRSGESAEVDSGEVTLTVGPEAITLKPGSVGSQIALEIRASEKRYGALTPGPISVTRLREGPLVTELSLALPCLAGDSHVLDLEIDFRVFAGKPHLHADVRALSRDEDIELTELSLLVLPRASEAPDLRAFTKMGRAEVSPTELRYNFGITERHDPIWYEDCPDPCWARWSAGGLGVAASIRNPHRHFPVGLSATKEGLRLDLQPSDEEPFHMYPWMAKTHEVYISLAPPDRSDYELTFDSALFQRPVRPVCGPDYYARCGAFGDIFPESRKYPAQEALISISLRERTVGVGKMHYGDEPNFGYTYDQRGHGRMVWTNCEYDTPRMLLMQYARTSNRSWFEAADAAARHLMDIDFIRHSENPRWSGGMSCHEGDHRVAAYAGPSHEWSEGLIDYYHLTGDERALETALSVGDNVCRYIEDGEFDRIGTYALRELGWGLTAITSCLRATGDERFRATGLRAIRILKRWVEDFGGLADVDPFPDESGEVKPLRVARDAFISLTLNGINRFYVASGEEEARELFLAEVRAQLEWFDGVDGWAEQRETKIPNLEAFGYAFRYTGDRAYLRAGLQVLEYAFSHCALRYYNHARHVHDASTGRPSTYRLSEVQPINSQILGLAVIPMFSFLQIAEEAGVLELALSPMWLGVES